MILHDSTAAPNPRLVRIFMAEKGISIPLVQVDLASGENRREPFLTKNPMAGVPVLELDDGTCIAETVAICRYLELTHPEKPMMGSSAREQALVEMWRRRAESEIAQTIGNAFRHTHPFFAKRIQQCEPYGRLCLEQAPHKLAWLDGVLEKTPFIGGESYTIADITALVWLDFGRVVNIRIGEQLPHLKRWHEAASTRPSAAA